MTVIPIGQDDGATFLLVAFPGRILVLHASLQLIPEERLLRGMRTVLLCRGHDCHPPPPVSWSSILLSTTMENHCSHLCASSIPQNVP